MPFLLVFAGGGAGALVRYLVSLGVGSAWDGSFPLGTFLINLTGCFLIGALAGLSERSSIDPQLRLFLQTGILGGYTTFSSFGLETVQLVHRGEWATAVAYVLGSNLLGLGLAFAGFWLVKGLVRPAA
jgi:CrcB protein